jgi:hypothetical protein
MQGLNGAARYDELQVTILHINCRIFNQLLLENHLEYGFGLHSLMDIIHHLLLCVSELKTNEKLKKIDSASTPSSMLPRSSSHTSNHYMRKLGVLKMVYKQLRMEPAIILQNIHESIAFNLVFKE